LDVNIVPASGENPMTLFRETTKAWVDINGPVRWLDDGSFLWLSDRSGWKHLYRYKSDGSFAGSVTNGDWDIRAVHGVDKKDGWVYFSGAERSHIGIDIYRVKLDGTGMKRLSERAGTHRARFSLALRITSTRGAISLLAAGPTPQG
jgi:dipeptidyl-peptidase-4